MNTRLVKITIIGSLGAFAAETVDLAAHGKVGHALPSAIHTIHITTVVESSTATISVGGVHHFGNATTEMTYLSVDGQVLKKAGQVQLP
jgi:hypothetical protein